ncbi:helix-turn-helix domain-containing protein [Kitasatospora sp. NPDC092948]|uniref:helix-turn-helix domain-containing protein n=1 Tax=Kitasatospora sp. NPDC092948 TaxID=3364088 RepID=UPI003814EC00
MSWTTVENAAYGYTWRAVTDPAPLEPPASQQVPVPSFARLTPEVVADMRRRYRSGQATFGGLARQYDVGEATVRNAVLGFTWRGVAEPPALRADVGGWTVLSEADEEQILKLKGEDVSYRAIAAALGHGVSVVYRAHRRLEEARRQP